MVMHGLNHKRKLLCLYFTSKFNGLMLTHGVFMVLCELSYGNGMEVISQYATIMCSAVTAKSFTWLIQRSSRFTSHVCVLGHLRFPHHFPSSTASYVFNNIMPGVNVGIAVNLNGEDLDICVVCFK